MSDVSFLYREIRCELSQADAELLSEALFDIDGVLSVTVTDAHAGCPDEQALFGEPGDDIDVHAWQRSVIVILIDHTLTSATLIEYANQILHDQSAASIVDYQVQTLADQDWVRATQAQFPPISVGQRIWIIPSWHQVPEQADAIVLQLDPGQAFGTGSHPTTRLCLEWLEANTSSYTDVLDYGCGSGILAIAAKKLGAQQVTGVDIDIQALNTAKINANQNQTDIAFFLPDELFDKPFDLVIANILSNPLKLMASMLSAKTKKGGHLVLSGILARQADEVIHSYAPWIKLEVWRAQEGWVCLAGKKL